MKSIQDPALASFFLRVRFFFSCFSLWMNRCETGAQAWWLALHADRARGAWHCTDAMKGGTELHAMQYPGRCCPSELIPSHRASLPPAVSNQAFMQCLGDMMEGSLETFMEGLSQPSLNEKG